MNIDLIVAVIFGIIFLSFSIWIRNVKTIESFSVSSKNIGIFFLFTSISATFIGPGYSLSFAKEGFSTGYLFLFIAIAYAIQTIIIGIFIAPKIREKFTDSYSIGDIIGGKKSHNNLYVHILAGVIAFSLTVGFSIVMAKAGGEILNNFLGIPSWQGIIILTFIVTAYTYFGGIKATIYTDTVQFILFVILIPLLILFIIITNDFNFTELYNKSLSLTRESIHNMSFITYIGLFASFLFGEALIPPLINRILAADNKENSAKAFILSGIFFIFWLFLMLTLGFLASLTLNTATSDQILLNLGKEYYGFGLFGLFSVAMIGIVMSSQDSLINAGATVFVKDIINVSHKILKKPIVSEKKQLGYAKLSTIFIGISSVFFAMYVPTILDGLLFFYSIWAPSILVVLLASVLLEQHFWEAGLLSMFSGILTSILWNIFQLNNFIPTVLVGIFVSFLFYTIVHFYKLLTDHTPT